jgi:hypothetical protein
MKRPLREQFVECRTIGHAWESFIPFDMRAPQIGYRLSVRCTRCPTERHDLVNRITGAVVQRQYVYPDGYALAEKLTRAQWRRRFVKTLSSQPRARLRSVS